MVAQDEKLKDVHAKQLQGIHTKLLPGKRRQTKQNSMKRQTGQILKRQI